MTEKSRCSYWKNRQ